MSLADKIQKQIKDKDIKPKPKWIFIAWQILLWTLIGSGILVLGLAMSLSWEILAQHDLPLMMRHPRGLLLAVKVLPYFWLIISLILSIIVYLEFERTKRAYKISFIYIIATIIFSTLILSGLFYFLGLSEKLEDYFEQQRSYHKMVPVPKKMWLNPEQGMLWGNILETKQQRLKLQDNNKKEWLIIINDDTVIEKAVILEQGQVIRVLGEQEENDSFEALFIKSWHKKSGQGKRPLKPMK